MLEGEMDFALLKPEADQMIQTTTQKPLGLVEQNGFDRGEPRILCRRRTGSWGVNRFDRG